MIAKGAPNPWKGTTFVRIFLSPLLANAEELCNPAITRPRIRGQARTAGLDVKTGVNLANTAEPAWLPSFRINGRTKFGHRARPPRGGLLASTVGWLAAGIACLGMSVSAAPRLALVVGNSAYKDARLSNPINDARLIGDTLTELGFEVTILRNADEDAMEEAVASLGERLRVAGPDAEGIFYYAGHGVQSSAGRNYVIPVGSVIGTESRLASRAVSADWVLNTMRSAGNAVNVLILDACRNNPYIGTRGGRGLAAMVPASDTLIAFSAADGQVADDGVGDNSPYAMALATEMRRLGRTFAQVFQNVRKRVLDGQKDLPLGERQTPTEVSQLTRDHFFVAPTGIPQASLDWAHEEWQEIKGTARPEVLEAFVSRHRGSRYADLARLRLNELLEKLAQPFTLVTEPANAQVRILDTTRRYRAGMRLPAGHYRMEVSAKGHATSIVPVRHGFAGPTRQTVALQRTNWDDWCVEVERSCNVLAERAKAGRLDAFVVKHGRRLNLERLAIEYQACEIDGSLIYLHWTDTSRFASVMRTVWQRHARASDAGGRGEELAECLSESVESLLDGLFDACLDTVPSVDARCP